MRSISENETPSQDQILRSLRAFPVELLKIYPRSFCSKNGLWYGLIRTSEAKRLVVMGERSHVLRDGFKGDCHHRASSLKLCDLSGENTECLMDLFSHTKPISLRKYPTTIGAGDWLGVAAPGHIRAVRKFQAHPVLVQYSVKEAEGIGRSLTEAIRNAAWAVFQENYQQGYEADLDRVKSLQEVECGLHAGFSMITLDLSEKTDSEAFRQPKDLIERRFGEEIDEGDAKVILHLFLDKEFVFRGAEGEFSIRFDEESVKRNALLFYKALDFAEEVYERVHLRRKNQDLIGFQISLDEIPFPTSPENHFFLALELSHRGVHIQSFTPRFVGEFQRDFKENRKSFREQFYQHILIAEDYGYKISINSRNNGTFPLSDIGELSKGFFHLKMGNTSWLEAMRLIALVNPPLFREMHSFAHSEFTEASKSHLTTIDLNRILKLGELRDEDLPALLDREDCRQLFHVTRGDLLNAKSRSGESLFRESLHQTLTRYEEDYWSMLEAHIEEDLSALGVPRPPLFQGGERKERK